MGTQNTEYTLFENIKSIVLTLSVRDTRLAGVSKDGLYL